MDDKDVKSTGNIPVENKEEITPDADISAVEEMAVMMSLFMNQANNTNDLTEKLTETHIDKMLDNKAKQMELDSKDVHEKRIHMTIIILAGLLVFVAAIWLLKDTPEIMTGIITALVSFAGGYGLGAFKSGKKSDD